MKLVTLKTIPYFCWVIISHTLLGCLSKNGPEVLTEARVSRLLALDTGKVWLRTGLRVDGDNVNLLDCELQNRYSFSFLDDTDTVFYIGALPNCTQLAADTLNRWSLRIVTNIQEEFLDSLELSNEIGEVFFKRITELTSDNLSWEFSDETGKIRETFMWQKEPLN